MFIGSEPYYLYRLRRDFEKRKAKNPSLSLRAYARVLQIQPPTLSGIFRGARPFPKRKVESIAVILSLSPAEKELFLQSVLTRTMAESGISKKKNQVLKDEEHFAIIADWENYATLALMDTKDFQPEPKWISQRLGISIERAKTAISQLEKAGLIKIQNNNWNKLTSAINTTEDIRSIALQKFHSDALNLGQRKLEEVDISSRDFSATTFAINKDRIPEAKTLIRQFRKKFSELMEVQNGEEVYQLCLQFYPLSNSNSENVST